MNGMILGAGLGTRLLPLTRTVPKALMPLGDRPLLAHLIEKLQRAGLQSLTLNAHHLVESLTTYCTEFFPGLVVLREESLLGTAGGLARAAAAFPGPSWLVWNGDIHAPQWDVAAMMDGHLASGSTWTWGVTPAPCGQGTVGVGRDGRVVRVRGHVFGVETGGAEFVGVQALSAPLLGALPAQGCLVADVALPLLRAGGTIHSFVSDATWHDVGTGEGLLTANQRWLAQGGIVSFRHPTSEVSPAVTLERVVAGPGVRIRGEGLVRDAVLLSGATLIAPAGRILCTSSDVLQLGAE